MSAKAFSLSDIDVRSLRVFLAVCDNHGITAAQTDLNMAVSTISNHITGLEERLSLTLCRRGRAGFQLTSEGERVLEAARDLLRSMTHFETNVMNARVGLSGTLRIGALDTALRNPNSPLLAALRAFNRRSTAVKFDIRIHSSSTCEKGVLSGDLDLALVCLPRKIEGLTYEFLFNEEQQLFCGRNHPLFSKDDRGLASHDLSTEKFVSRDMWMQIEAAHFMAEKADALVNHIDAKAFMIQTGLYLGFMPVLIAEPFLKTGAMRSIRPQQYSWMAPYYLITRNGTRISRAMVALMEDIHANLKLAG